MIQKKYPQLTLRIFLLFIIPELITWYNRNFYHFTTCNFVDIFIVYHRNIFLEHSDTIFQIVSFSLDTDSSLYITFESNWICTHRYDSSICLIPANGQGLVDGVV